MFVTSVCVWRVREARVLAACVSTKAVAKVTLSVTRKVSSNFCALSDKYEESEFLHEGRLDCPFPLAGLQETPRMPRLPLFPRLPGHLDEAVLKKTFVCF